MRSSRSLILVTLAILMAAPAFGAGTITNGIDTWTTPADGSTFVDFASQPIPAGFFCRGSEAFTGRIAFQGAPLASQPADALGQADTIVQRLDDAVFDSDGRATTRLQVRALALESLAPVRVRCGEFNVRATLHGEQPITKMEITRDGDDGGLFVANLALAVRLTFTPASGKQVRGLQGRTLTLDQQIELGTPPSRWASEQPEKNLAGQIGGFVLVDTDGDAITDTFLPGQSAFHPVGVSAEKIAIIDEGSGNCITPPGAICHEYGMGDSSHCHCAYP